MTAKTDDPRCRWCHGVLARIRGGVLVCPTCDVPPKSVWTPGGVVA